MTRYLKVTESNPGSFQVRLEPNAYIKGDVAVNVDITTDPQPFDDGRAEHLLNVYPGQVEEVAVSDVPDEFLSVEDTPEPETETESESERFACKVEDCDKDYASQTNLARHTKAFHGNPLQKLFALKINEDDPDAE